jgi:hypothetical protein
VTIYTIMIFVIETHIHSNEGGKLMKRIAMLLMLVSLMLMVVSVIAIAQEKAATTEKAPVKAAPKYVGAVKCKMCHNSAAKGEQYKKWSTSKHAKALEVLATPEADSIGRTLGITQPQESEKCLVCHVAGYAAPATAKAATYSQAEGVSCEACHGPGSDYMAMSVMKDKTAAIAAGLVVPNEKTCVTCHNDKSPTFKSFVFADFMKVIAHPMPKAPAAK